MAPQSLALGTLLLVCQAAAAQELFVNCDAVASEKSYRPLTEYLSSARIQGANYCQRLNSREFVYTTENNFYYCDFKATAVPCVENTEGVWYPNLEIDARFAGSNGKRFVLFKASRLSHGVYESGYHVFFFAPKTVAVRGYEISALDGAGDYNGSYSDAGETCSDLGRDKDATSVTKYEIVNAGTKDVTIRFAQAITACKTGAQRITTLEYVWSGREFTRGASNAGVRPAR